MTGGLEGADNESNDFSFESFVEMRQENERLKRQ